MIDPQQPGSDTRTSDHLANERTYLAWLRTGASVMLVGLAVARFLDNSHAGAASINILPLLAGALLWSGVNVGQDSYPGNDCSDPSSHCDRSPAPALRAKAGHGDGRWFGDLSMEALTGADQPFVDLVHILTSSMGANRARASDNVDLTVPEGVKPVETGAV